MNDITQPLIMSVGSHQRGSGRGCVMNLISWCDGDAEITDFPSSVNVSIARLLQQANDGIGGRTPTDTVPAAYARRLLDIAFAARGTSAVDEDQANIFIRRGGHLADVVGLAPYDFDNGRISADQWLDRLENLIIQFKRAFGLAPVTPPTPAVVDEALAKMTSKVDA